MSCPHIWLPNWFVCGVVFTELSAGLCAHLQAEQDWTLLSWRPGGHTALHGASHRHTQDPLQALFSVHCLNMEDGIWCKHSAIIYSCFLVVLSLTMRRLIKTPPSKPSRAGYYLSQVVVDFQLNISDTSASSAVCLTPWRDVRASINHKMLLALFPR